MANAVAMKGASIQVIHDTVYQEAKAGIPQPIFDHLTGNDPNEPASESNSFAERFRNPYHFAEFLPCFAIRPIFVELLYSLHYWLGMGLLKAVVIVPVLSYWLMAWVVFSWACRYVPTHWAALITVLLFLTPPLWDLGRSTTPDALSGLAVLLAMFFLFEQRRLFPGTVVLLAAVYIRTDNALLALIVLCYLFLSGFGLKIREAIVLSAVAITSVILINHFAGDYGPRVLYYRSFIEPPIAVAEIVPRFGVHEYIAALRLGFAGCLHGPYITFLLMGIVGMMRSSSRPVLALATTTAVYTAAHLIIFPNPETRFFGLFFVATALIAVPTARVVSSAVVSLPSTRMLPHLRRPAI